MTDITILFHVFLQIIWNFWPIFVLFAVVGIASYIEPRRKRYKKPLDGGSAYNILRGGKR